VETRAGSTGKGNYPITRRASDLSGRYEHFDGGHKVLTLTKRGRTADRERGGDEKREGWA